MVQPYPLPRETRESAVLTGDGSTVEFGPFPFKIFDVADVEVWQKPTGGAWAKVTVVVSKTTFDPLSHFKIYFSTAPLATTQFAVFGRRLHERATDLTKAGVLQSAEIEKEFSKQGAILQELRRDVDRSWSSPPGQTAKQIATIPEGHYWVSDANGNLVDGGNADEIQNAQGYAESALASKIAAQAAAETARDEANAALALINADVPALVLIPAGQSNDVDRAPQAVTIWPSKLKTFNGGSAMLVSGQAGYVNAMWARPEADFASLADWAPSQSGKGSYVAGFAQSDERYARIVAFGAAVGARHWRDLDPGEGAFANVCLAMWHGVRLLKASGYQPTNIDVVIPFALGESDADTTGPGGTITEAGANKAQWQAVMAKAKAAYRQQWRFATGLAAAEIKLLASPMAIQDDDSSRLVNDAVLAAAQGDSEIILPGPRYCFPHEGDGIHMTGIGQYLRGYHEKLRLAQMRADDAKRLPLHVTGASWTGTTLTIDFNRECQIDTTTIAETTTSFPNSRYGIEIFDSGTPVAISSGSMTSATRFTGVTASAKSGTATGRIGQMTWPGGTQTVTLNSSANKMARSNFREPSALATVTVQGTAYPLYNWACQQALPF